MGAGADARGFEAFKEVGALSFRTLFLAAALGALAVGPWEGTASAALITGISVPVDSMDESCRPRNEGV